MRTHFAEVLERESTYLAGVADASQLAAWRQLVVEEIMTPSSPYAQALRHGGDVPGRDSFLDRWRALIMETVGRLQQSSTTLGADGPSSQLRSNDVDCQKTAVLILAALHGGSTLSYVAQDPWPLDAALDVALAPFAVPQNAGELAPDRTTGSVTRD